jgi:hypothetical protein
LELPPWLVEETPMFDDGRNGSRARSARIRSAHDHEATALETMRRRAPGEPKQRARIARIVRACMSLVPRRREQERAAVAENVELARRS